ncbi:hypothetical protein FACS189454_04320 [Planctomycetales bacterium]|nr:hypothetical protein FACS189454_04320 [Planctomycetales bacterium]
MNIYEKHNKVKQALTGLRMTGKHFSGWHYFELRDILPKLTQELSAAKLHLQIDFADNGETATLILTNCEKPEEKLLFHSPVKSAERPVAEGKQKQTTGMQDIGAAQTMIRRYLIINAFDIVENAAAEMTSDEPRDESPRKNETERDFIIRRIGDLLHGQPEDYKNIVREATRKASNNNAQLEKILLDVKAKVIRK